MPFNWEKLKISQAEIDSVCEFKMVDSWAIALSRLFLLRQREYWQQVLFTELSILFLSLLLFFPINLIVFRKLILLSSSSTGLFLVLVTTTILSILLMIIFNYYLWQQAKKLKLTSKLLNKVLGHNSLINNFQLLANIEKLTEENYTDDNQSIVELKTAFQLTKKSLLKSIELEGFLCHHHQQQKTSFAAHKLDRYQLLTNLEQNLVSLSLPETNSNQEYQELLNEAVEIGLSIHREMRIK